MSRLFLRRGRILPGPLKVLQPAERRSPVPVKALALTSAALAATLLLLPHLSPRLSVDPTPTVEYADAAAVEPVSVAYAEPEPLRVAATPVQAEPVAVPVTRVADDPVRPVAAKPAVDPSLFQVDLLPVLQADGVDLEPASVPPRAMPKAASRRNAAAPRGTAVVASGGPAQH